ncbi:MAG TPA: response regulator [Ktedonobacterales bacterium]|nr:response regulator [Ktedonobacterales bacterium]
MSSVRANASRRQGRQTRMRAMAPAAHAHVMSSGSVALPAPHKPSRHSRPASASVTLLPRAAAPTLEAVAPVAERTHPSILIVEDDPHAAHAIRDTLALEGEPDWDIQVAEGGERALALAASRPPNVVLLDVNLPDLDGAEVYRRLRVHPETWKAHVLFLTAATSLDLYQRGVEAGVVLRKPFEMRELVSLVRTLVVS